MPSNKKTNERQLTLWFAIINNEIGLSADDAKLIFGCERDALDKLVKIGKLDKLKYKLLKDTLFYYMPKSVIEETLSKISPEELYRETKNFFSIILEAKRKFATNGNNSKELIIDRIDYLEEFIQRSNQHLHAAAWLFDKMGVIITVPLVWINLVDWYLKTDTYSNLLLKSLKNAYGSLRASETNTQVFEGACSEERRSLRLVVEEFETVAIEIRVCRINNDQKGAKRGIVALTKILHYFNSVANELSRSCTSEKLQTEHAYTEHAYIYYKTNITYFVELSTTFIWLGDSCEKDNQHHEAQKFYEKALDTINNTIERFSLGNDKQSTDESLLNNSAFQSDHILFQLKATALEKLGQTSGESGAIKLGKHLEEFFEQNGQFGQAFDEATVIGNLAIAKLKNAIESQSMERFQEALKDNARAIRIVEKSIVDADLLQKRVAELYEQRCNFYIEFQQFGKAVEWYDAYEKTYLHVDLKPVIHGGDIPACVRELKKVILPRRIEYLRSTSSIETDKLPSMMEYAKSLLDIDVFFKAIRYVTDNLITADKFELSPGEAPFIISDESIVQAIFLAINLIYAAAKANETLVTITQEELATVRSKELRDRLEILSEKLNFPKDRAYFVESLL